MGSKAETDSQLEPAETDFLEKLVTALIVFEVAVFESHLSPLKGIADPSCNLPSQIGVAGAYIGLIFRSSSPSYRV